MKYQTPSVPDHYVDVEYHQFTQSAALRRAQRLAGALTWPLILPLAALSRRSDFIFRTCAEALSLVPYLFGVIFRREFYRWTLARCGENLAVGFGSFFFYRGVRIGDNVLIGNYNIFHHCDLGSYVLIADHCQFLSGARYHRTERTDRPMALQGGQVRRIRIGDDCWIGAGALVMNDVGAGGVVGAGAVVIDPVEPYSVVAGNPAREIKRRLCGNAQVIEMEEERGPAHPIKEKPADKPSPIERHEKSARIQPVILEQMNPGKAPHDPVVPH